jgi:ubiquinone/menaquinone biosynthesis C-methylase UbiE
VAEEIDMSHAIDTTASDARFWDRIARKYADDPIKDMDGYERTVACTRGYLAPTDRVFELGCGTGTTALKLAASVAHVTATDVSGEMITVAREKAASQGIRNIDVSTASHRQLPFGNDAFDVALAFNVLHLLDDRPQALHEVHRILKPGGLFVSKTPCLREMNPLIRLALPVARMIGKAPYVSAFAADTLERDIAAAGFAIEERARHGSTRKDPRLFLVARKVAAA